MILRWQELETYGKHQFDRLNDLFKRQKDHPKSTTQTTSEINPALTNTASAKISKHDRVLTSKNRYAPKENKKPTLRKPTKSKTKE